MKHIFIIGAGRSSASLIQYLLDSSTKENWRLCVGDASKELAIEKTNHHPNARAIQFDVNDSEQLKAEVEKADIVVSMLPATLHILVAKECVRLKKHLVTASYVSKEMKQLDEEAKASGVLLMNESGLDPGIDHASAMKIIDEIHAEGGELEVFKSYTGGLVAPEFNDNPWGYKFTWNPRNVVLAGQGVALYIENGEYKEIPYEQLFTQTEPINVDIPQGDRMVATDFEGYANRDSLSYRELYHLQNIPTMLRGTLRMPGYCKAWNVFVNLGLTSKTNQLVINPDLTYAEWFISHLPKNAKKDIEHALRDSLGDFIDDDVIEKLKWLGLFEKTKISSNTKTTSASSAQILQDLLEKKWALKKGDKDMIVMQHVFKYKTSNGENKKITSSLVVKGDDEHFTAMAKTVGLPLAILTKLILKGRIKQRGVQIPTTKEIYEPLLDELQQLNITFNEKRE